MSKGRRSSETKVTRFGLDPKGLQEKTLLALQMLVQELMTDDMTLPASKELCIELLSKDYRGK